MHNHGMPSQVDREPLQVGKDLAVTPGAVIFRNEVFELIQYAPQAAEVHARPLLIVPPQVNKYYALDLAPGRSMSEYLLRDGFQLFEMSWRNPTVPQRDWGFDTYAQAVLDAIDVVGEVSGSADVNLMGGCLGGMMVALVTALLEARGDTRVQSATMTVTLLDMDTDAKIMLFASPRTLALAKQVSDRAGVIEGWEMAQMFAWLRPNDLVWNYWVNNYLLGRKPPAFDILAWNADTTRLTARFHEQLLDLVAENQLAKPGALEVLGTPIDLSRITRDTYVAAGLKDHITPWQGGYQTTQMVGGKSEFVLCSSGHIQTVVAAPDHPRLGYFVNPDTPAEPEKWLADAQRHEGSWWAHWSDWLASRSGELVAAPASLGSTQYPPKEPAPGAYIFQ
jgi:poly[(R)-3-hydroxyalkanoate] polymerase subunit PhaC